MDTLIVQPVTNRPRWFIAAGGIYVLAGGCAALLGWAADLPSLTDWNGSGISMQPNAAVVAILTGIALLLTARGRDQLAAWVGLVVAVIAGATLLEYLLGVSFGFDTLLMFDRPWGRKGTLAPGRMGPPGSTSWTLAGIALVLNGRMGNMRRAVSFLGLLVASIAGLSLTGYLFGADMLYTLPRLTTIALQTATFLLVVGLALVAVAHDREPMRTLREDSGAGELARITLSLVILVPVLLGYVCVRGQRAGLYDTAMGTALLVLSLIFILCAVLWCGVRAVRRREAALRRSEGELADFFENASIGLHWVGADGTILRVNQAELDLLGYCRDEYVGHHISEFHADREVIVDILKRLSAGETIHNYDARLRRKDGSICFGVINSNVLWEDGRFIHTRCFTRDVTDQKIAEDALREADRRKDEFLATLAHELRNPLAPVRNSLEIMKRANGDAEVVIEAQATMERQIGHMVRLIDDLLDVSRITHNLVELRKERVELASIIHHATEACRPAIDSAGHEILVTLPPEPIYVDGDPVRLGQVFGNLMTNACKYTDQGGQVWVTVERQGRDVVVSVKDSGIGIPREMLPRVFEMFTQVDRSLERAQSGLGIGLTLVKRLVEMHGGTVAAFSEGVGKGSEFVVRLPMLISVPQVPTAPPPTSKQSSALSRRVLVVDDNRDSATSLARLLQLTGNQTETAHDGAEAVEKAETYKPDVILLDIGLPKMNGYDVCRTIRREPWGKETVIVALTGWGQVDDR